MRLCPICERNFDDDVRECPDDNVRTLKVDEGMSKYVGYVLDERWRLGELIGEGGMGAVYRGQQVNLDRPVAVKLIRAEFARDDMILSRFFREAKIMSALQHPNIVTMLDFGQDEETGALYLVMELLRGTSLSELLEERRIFSLHQVLSIGAQLAAALSESHQQNVVHRDLKPENIFIDEVPGRDIHVTLIDFGIARVDDNQVTKLTKTGAIQGTPTYMAPEQIEGLEIVPQTDFYALGVILYEMIAGQEPFPGDSLMQVLMAHLTAEPPDLSERWRLQQPVSRMVVDLVHGMLSKNPEDRPESALQLVKTLQSLSSSALTAARELGISDTFGVDVSALDSYVPQARRRSSIEQKALDETLPGSPPPSASPEVTPSPLVLPTEPTLEATSRVPEWTLDGPGPSQEVMSLPPGQLSQPSGAGKWVAIGVALIVLGLVGVGATWALTRDQAPKETAEASEETVEAKTPLADTKSAPVDPVEADAEVKEGIPDEGAVADRSPVDEGSEADEPEPKKAAIEPDPKVRRRRVAERRRRVQQDNAAPVAKKDDKRTVVVPPSNKGDVKEKRSSDLQKELDRMMNP